MLNQNLSPPVSCFTTEAGVSSEGGATASNARLSWSPATLFTTVARRKSRNPVSTSSSGASSAGRSLGTGATSPGLIASRYAARPPRWLVDLQNRHRLDDVCRNYRPMVERTIAGLVRGKNRKLRCHGIERNQLWLAHRAAAVNLRRLLNLGLGHDGRGWM